LRGYWPQSYLTAEMTYRMFPPDLVANFSGYEFGGRGMYMMNGAVSGMAVAAPPPAGEMLAQSKTANAAFLGAETERMAGAKRPEKAGAPGTPPGPDLSQVTARKNLNETAFRSEERR